MEDNENFIFVPKKMILEGGWVHYDGSPKDMIMDRLSAIVNGGTIYNRAAYGAAIEYFDKELKTQAATKASAIDCFIAGAEWARKAKFEKGE